jgi:hypothetical protein
VGYNGVYSALSYTASLFMPFEPEERVDACSKRWLTFTGVMSRIAELFILSRGLRLFHRALQPAEDAQWKICKILMKGVASRTNVSAIIRNDQAHHKIHRAVQAVSTRS